MTNTHTRAYKEAVAPAMALCVQFVGGKDKFTRLVAPIDGIAGRAQLQVGALVSTARGSVRAAWLSLDAGDAPLLKVSNGIKLGG